jgi:CHRD domain
MTPGHSRQSPREPRWTGCPPKSPGAPWKARGHRKALRLVRTIVAAAFPLVMVGAGTANDAAPATTRFSARLSGDAEVPPVATKAHGEATFHLDQDGLELHYILTVRDIVGVTMAHLHMVAKGGKGPIVAWLYPTTRKPKPVEGPFTGKLAEGTIKASSLVGPLKGKTLDTLLERIRAGDIYVQVLTRRNPAGEIRGKVH